MLEAITYNNMISKIKDTELFEDTIGILFTRPDLDTGKNILEELPYYHHITGNNINFFLPGYGAYWSNDMYPDKKDIVTIDGTNWSFSYKAFVKFINELEELTKWHYSGESELLLIPYHDYHLDYSNVALFHLDQMLKDKAISSISNFITHLSRKAKNNNSINSIRHKEGLQQLTQSLIDETINSLPSYLSRTVKEGRHYVKHNISK